MNIKSCVIVFSLLFFKWGICFSQTGDIEDDPRLLITDPAVLNGLIVEGEKNDVNSYKYDLAYLMGQVSVYLGKPNTTKRPQTKNHVAFVENIFSSTAQEQKAHNKADPQNRLGMQIDDGSIAGKPSKLMDRIFSQWKLPDTDRNNINNLKGSPFRLLAIANLMDQAGLYDERGLAPNTIHPRALGELHLVYGYVDSSPAYEGAAEPENRKAYPQTFVLSYRIPVPSDFSFGAVVEEDSRHEWLMIKANHGKWQDLMKQWAERWEDLSKEEIGSSVFVEKLNAILDDITQPENFLNLRSNTQLDINEFELRELYIVNQDSLIPRKPRNEAYRCLQTSSFLPTLIGSYWMAGTEEGDYDDLNVSTITIKTIDKSKGIYEVDKTSGKNGFTVFRDLDRVKEYNTKVLGKTVVSQNKAGIASCNPDVASLVPFEMPATSGTREGTSPRLIPPFARAGKVYDNVTQEYKTEDFVWKITDATGNTTVSELQRHQFAMRTCSGCHGVEGAVKGFHISNRLPDEKAKLSAYLTGKGENTFEHDGQVYTYRELENRNAWFGKFLNRNANLFDSLKRTDHH